MLANEEEVERKTAPVTASELWGISVFIFGYLSTLLFLSSHAAFFLCCCYYCGCCSLRLDQNRREDVLVFGIGLCKWTLLLLLLLLLFPPSYRSNLLCRRSTRRP